MSAITRDVASLTKDIQQIRCDYCCTPFEEVIFLENMFRARLLFSGVLQYLLVLQRRGSLLNIPRKCENMMRMSYDINQSNADLVRTSSPKIFKTMPESVLTKFQRCLFGQAASLAMVLSPPYKLQIETSISCDFTNRVSRPCFPDEQPKVDSVSQFLGVQF